MARVLVAAGTDLPITRVDAKLHLRITHSSEDAFVDACIAAATAHAEDFTRRALSAQEWVLVLDRFPCGEIKLPLPPLRSVASVKYFDTDGAEQTLAAEAYQVDTASDPGRIAPAPGTSWPSTRRQMGAVRIQFECGYETPDEVPESTKHAIRFLTGLYFLNREAAVTGTIVTKIPFAVEALLWPQRVLEF